MTGVISEFQNRSLFDIARMLPWKAGEWLVVMADPEKREPAMVELLDELTAGDVPARRLRVGEDKNAWVNRMQDPPKDIVLLEGFDHWTPRDWQEADYLRSRLSRLGPQVWLLTPSGVRDMVNHAPNIASFVGGRVFGIGQDAGLLSDDEIDERLRSYRKHYGISDEQLIDNATQRKLAWEPEFAEWLALLGRGDLIP